MAGFCISSIVSNVYANIDYDFFREIIDSEELFNEDRAFSILLENNMKILAFHLQDKIDNFLKLQTFDGINSQKIYYKGKVYVVNLRNSEHFYLVWLIQIYDMVTLTLKLNGNLYLFNKQRLDIHDGDRIVSYLRVHRSIIFEEIYEGINLLLQDLRINQTIDRGTVFSGLENLVKYGLVYKHPNTLEYSLTAIGYIYW